ncbi:MAG: nucleotide exchange factor GrpE [Clostridium sp.]|nr:nucleotide exchange factor GrpE [Clostridium sp.]
MEEKKKQDPGKKKQSSKKSNTRAEKPAAKEMAKETVEEVAVTSTEETEVEAKEVSEDTGSKPPAKGKKGARRSGGNNKALELEIQKQKELTDEANDKYKRLLAEFENARNRNEKESKRMYDIGAKEVLEKLLPVVDNFERALQMVPEEDKERGFEQGVDKIYRQLMVAFEEIGVAPMNAEGTEFNPDLHNAVMHVEDEAFGENVVMEELQKGYMYKEEVLRHSMVKVAN